MPINKKASTIIRLSMLSSSRGDWIRTSDHTPPRLWYLLHDNHWLSDFSVISLCFGLIYGLIRQWTKMFDNKLIISLQSYTASQSYWILLSYAMNYFYNWDCSSYFFLYRLILYLTVLYSILNYSKSFIYCISKLFSGSGVELSKGYIRLVFL